MTETPRPETHESSLAGGQRLVLAFLFAVVAISYIDRSVISVLKPVLDVKLGWDQKDYGWMVTAFQAAYAVGYLLAGRWVDRIGVRIGLMLAVALWSAAAAGQALAHTAVGFSVVLSALGLAEGACFPAAIKAVAEWFPREQRAFATGLFNAGSSVGAIACPLMVPWLAQTWGWQGTFIATGAIGFFWVAAWAWLYRTPPGQPTLASPAEPNQPVPWAKLIQHKQTWAFVIGMMAAAPVWWFYIFWTPDFLNKRFHLSLTQSSAPLMVIFLVSSVGGILGGALSSVLLRRGWTLNATRKTVLLVCALAVLPVVATPLVPTLWWAVALVAVAAASHCGYAANLYTLVSDTVPSTAVASVVGIGGMAGSLAGMGLAQLVSRVLQFTHNNYIIPFAFVGSTYIIALGVIHVLLPQWEKMSLAPPPNPE